ncbi:MAG: hypothetical protein KAI39_01820 [Desulfobulbaceae bacterium]|nr:hypothetical protein [Desulfobulbaceae bacterium]
MHFKQGNNSLLFGAIISILLGSMFFAMSAQALDSNELIAVANGQERDSVKLENQYM